MEMSKIVLAIISLISLAIVHHAHAQDSQQDFLRAHNTARASVGVGPMRWSSTVAAFARNYTNGLRRRCRMVHSSGPYGENLAWGSANLTAPAAVKMWVDEANYDYSSNSCAGGECMHYTQVVWRKSVRLGCAKKFKLQFSEYILSHTKQPVPYKAVTLEIRIKKVQEPGSHESHLFQILDSSDKNTSRERLCTGGR
uniref:SCP domain-containing protein n=1 Tax=Salix viminalis TaxID=40686 RepID=A0A6N2LUN4_SALVM